MKFACESCGTRYNIADAKVRHKVLKIRCRVCTSVITVRGADIDRRDDVEDAPKNEEQPEAGRPQQAGWFAAPDGEEIGPVPLERLKAMVEVGDVSAETLVWRDGMDDWLPVSDVPELNRHLPRTSQLDEEATSTFEVHDRIDDSLRHMLLGTPPADPFGGDSAPQGRMGWEVDDRPTLAEPAVAAIAAPAAPIAPTPELVSADDGQRRVLIVLIVLSVVVLLALVGVATWWFFRQADPVVPPAEPAVAPAGNAEMPVPTPPPAAPPPAAQPPAAQPPAAQAPAAQPPVAAPATLTRDQVKAVVDGNRPAIDTCRETHLAGKPPAKPRMMLTFEIRPTGRTNNPTVDAPFAGSPFGDCVLTAVRGWSFPVFTGAPMPIEYPLVFEEK